jgi:hypothetical protein
MSKKANTAPGVLTHLYALVMQLQAISDTSPEHVTDFRTIPVLPSFTFHPTLLVNNSALDDPISDGLTDDIFSIFFGIQMEFEADVTQ